MLGDYTLTYSKAYIFIHGWNGNLGSLFYTALGCKKFYRIGPIIWVINYLCGGVIDDFLCGQIAFVSDEQLIDVFTGVTIDLLKPLLDVVERFLISHVVDNDDAVSAAVITEKKTQVMRYMLAILHANPPC